MQTAEKAPGMRTEQLPRRPRPVPDAGTGRTGRVLDLTDPAAADPDEAGAKAANLAQAASAGLPVLPGVVLGTGGRPDPAAVRDAWVRLSRAGSVPVVVRSSSTVEDAGESSMAGQFRSVLGVCDWEAFQTAVAEVLRSAERGAAPGEAPAPMAVLVQPELLPASGGVLFGVDPVTGDRRRMMVEAVPGSPHRLVDGTATAARYVTTRRGRVLEPADAPLLDPARLRRLARLARRAERVFGRPQDIEWAFDGGGRLWLLQSRPVTATGHQSEARGPVLGPGPVSETFPSPLRPLEVDLWVTPLRTGIVEALRLTGGVSRRRLAGSPVVVVVRGRVAVDLELLGAAPARRSLARALDPRGPARRLVAAWQVGRLRDALPGAAAATIHEVDRHLAAVPSLASLSERELVGLLLRVPDELVPLHAHEVLAGMLLPGDGAAPATGSVALGRLAEGRASGWPDDEIVARTPVVLALTSPRVGPSHPLPPASPTTAPATGRLSGLDWRDALRLRSRWVQEVGSRAATELGERLSADGRLPTPDVVAFLTLGELASVVSGAPSPGAGLVADRRAAAEGTPLPPTFRLTARGEVVAIAAGMPPAGGRAAGGGRGSGTVRHDATPGGGGVLVVENLSPELAAVLPGLAGLVSETGSTLSHLAILAREFGVPTVVGVPHARQRFPAGTIVVVDGGTGEVSPLTGPEGGQR